MASRGQRHWRKRKRWPVSAPSGHSGRGRLLPRACCAEGEQGGEQRNDWTATYQGPVVTRQVPNTDAGSLSLLPLLS